MLRPRLHDRRQLQGLPHRGEHKPLPRAVLAPPCPPHPLHGRERTPPRGGSDIPAAGELLAAEDGGERAVPGEQV